MGLLSFIFPWGNISGNPVEVNKPSKTGNNDIVNESNPVNNVVHLQKPTGLPIDSVYGYLRQDFEQKGYNEAIGGADSSFKESVKDIIKHGLIIQIEYARLKYEDDLDVIEIYVQDAKNNGLFKAESELEAKKKIYYKHLSVLDKIENNPDEQNHYLMYMYESYKRGFLHGLTDVARKL